MSANKLLQFCSQAGPKLLSQVFDMASHSQLIASLMLLSDFLKICKSNNLDNNDITELFQLSQRKIV